MKLYRLLFVVLLIPCLIHAQTKHKSEEDAILRKADSLASLYQFDSAYNLLILNEQQLLYKSDTLSFFKSQLIRCQILEQQARYDSSLVTTQKALSKMHEFGFFNELLTAKFKRQLGIVYEKRDADYFKAIDLYYQAIAETQQIKEADPLAIILKKDIANSLIGQGFIDSAQLLLKDVTLELKARFPGEYWELSETHRLTAITNSMKGIHDLAKVEYQKALQASKEVSPSLKQQSLKANIFGNMAVTFHLDGYYDSALHFYHKKKNIYEKIFNRNDESLSNVYSNISSVYITSGNPDSASYYIEEAIEINESVLTKNHPKIADLYIKKSSLLTQLNRYEEAQNYAEQSLSILETLYGKDHPANYNALTNLGFVYLENENYGNSLKYYKRALRAHDTGEVKQWQSYIYAHLKISDNYFALGQLDSARSYINSAKRLSLNRFDSDSEIVGRVRQKSGRYFNEKGNYDEAIKEFEAARNIFLSYYGSRDFLVSQSLQNIGAVLLKMDSTDLAIKRLQESLVANSYNFSSERVGETPDLDDMIDPLFGIETIMEIAESLWLDYQRTGNIETLSKSLDQFLACERLLSEMLYGTSVEGDALNAINYFHDVYSDIINIQTQRKRLGLLPTLDYENQIFKYSEKSRGIHLLYSQLKAQARSDKFHALDNFQSLNQDIASTKSMILSLELYDMDSSRINYYKDKLFDLNQRKGNLRESLTANNSLPFDEFAETSDNLFNRAFYQSKLSQKQAVVEYFVSDTTLFSIVLTKGKLHLVSAPYDREKLVADIKAYLAFKENNAKEHLQGANELYKTLIQPLESLLREVEQLVIIPEKELWNINFDLLADATSSEESYSKANYLFKKYSISYSYSLSSLFKNGRRTTASKQMLAFALEEKEQQKLGGLFAFRSNDKSKITGTITELDGLNKSYSGDYFYGSFASEDEFKKRVGDYRIIHLALHGNFDDSNINSSHLIFNKTENDTEQDGYLYPFELYDLEVNSDLIVLSACHSGAGEIINGEGIMSIGRGFLYAGANSLLLSQWELSDAVAPELMISFYEYLDKGFEKDKALRQAKLDFMETANNITSNPLYWGSFFILGDTSPVEFKPSHNWKKYWLPAILILLLVLAVIKKRSILRHPRHN
ncbi:MAG: CHAT domain-containing protein [Roseivirga sp.]|jgi:CHAT domain-containing protein|uniref:CHAT domain-containing protein n=1 Tax=Roseivirga sp. TaxID=1964215 RepID=UPI001B14440E|nr:CHAT domain-containing protein [Roseivirga sp.]MBO6494417.1 CHAT domain-containing protein [Roseivirga sp.]